MAKTMRHIWYGSVATYNAAVLDGDTLHVGHLPTQQMGPAYDALTKGAAVRDWFGAAGKVIPVSEVRAIQAINLMSQLKIGYYENGQPVETEINVSSPEPTVAAQLLVDAIGADDWDEENERIPVGDALRWPIGLALLPSLFAGLFAYLATRPRPVPTGDSFNDGINDLLFRLGPWPFVGLIAVFVAIGILVGIRAVKNRPAFRLKLVRKSSRNLEGR